ncbi:MAG: DinB family protein [Bryobacteraceae bacterium]
MDKKELIETIRLSVEGEAWHGPSVKEVLEGVTAEAAAWKPPAGLHSIAELTLHITAWMEEIVERLEGRHHKEPPRGNFPQATADWDVIRGLPGEALARLLDTLEAFPERRLSEQAQPGFSFAGLLSGAAQHNVYHAGQIALLKKLA